MIQVSSGRASDAAGHVDTRGRWSRLLPVNYIRVASAALLLAGGFNMTSSAFAQTAQSPADCVEKCKVDEKQCLYNGSSEELCEYDSKGCQKTCSESK